MRVLEEPRAAVAHVKVARDREQPRAQPAIGAQPVGVLHEAQPGFLEQVFGDVPATRQPQQESEDRPVEGQVDGIEGVGIALTEAVDQLEFSVPVHGVIKRATASSVTSVTTLVGARYTLSDSSLPARCHMNVLRQASLFALLTLILGCVPFVMAVVYVIRPTERHLALMRPLSLAGLFASIGGAVLGFINVLHIVWTRELTAETYKVIAVGSAESLVPTLVGFASLTTAWLLVAVGMGRQGARLS